MLKTISALLILISFNAAADDAVITVTGRVVLPSCTIEKDGDTLTLRPVFASQLRTVELREIMIRVTKCPRTLKRMTAVFSGKPSPFPDLFENEGTAKNVYVKLFAAKTRPSYEPQLVSNNHPWSDNFYITNSDGTRQTEFLLSAQAVSPNNNAVEGTIRTSINITFTYN